MMTLSPLAKSNLASEKAVKFLTSSELSKTSPSSKPAGAGIVCQRANERSKIWTRPVREGEKLARSRSEEALDVAGGVEADAVGGGDAGEAGHRHHVAADGDEELRSRREAHLADGDGVA